MKGIQKLSCHWSRLLLSGESFDRDCLCKRVETVECGKRPKRNEMASYSKGASRLGGGLSWGLLKKRGRGGGGGRILSQKRGDQVGSANPWEVSVRGEGCST